MLAASIIFVIAYMRLEGREPWRVVLPCTFVLMLFNITVFDQLLRLPWPEPEFLDVVVELRSLVLDFLRI
jgi:hypothetical protein